MKRRGKRAGATKSAYALSGVDIDEKMDGLASVKEMIRGTRVKGLLTDIGTFGGIFASPGKDSALVASTDGVGTKLKVAVMAGRHDTVGQDIVNHCVNDILVQGATPLFFLDYFGSSKFRPDVFRQVISGICKACRENGCALLGGETAEMPGLYPENEYDLVGTIVGAVPMKGIITGKTIRKGDVLIGLPSSGLHTNGYSLARRVIFETAGLRVEDAFPGDGRTVADVLLEVHRSYLVPVTKLMKRVRVRGMAHITGGGFPDNVVRILPHGTCAVIDRSTWHVPQTFRFIQETGKVDRDEMYRVFNMGIGLLVAVRERDTADAIKCLTAADAHPILAGRVEGVRGRASVRLIK